MPSVDDRIVRISFDNKDFESKVSQTLSSIQKLNESLKMKGAQDGLNQLSTAANKVDLGTKIGASIEGVSGKFLAMATVGVTALANITSKAVTAGASIVKSLSLDNVIAGFQEYETNIGSIQTILANTKAQGTNLGQVNAALDQLNTYSDKTIYNFGQMAHNIGTFTAAGVNLDTSVSAIKGIANLAAISGSSADQASTAMYQLSQAIASGSVKLMDWNSVVNAGMGGKTFQNALFEAGKAMGKFKDVPVGETFDQWTKKGNSFRDSLHTGWLTADVLTTTLGGVAGELSATQLQAKGFSKEQANMLVELGKTGIDAATKVRTFTQLMSTVKESIGSGWSETFRTIFGNFEEATTLFTNVSNVIGVFVGRSSDARNKMLAIWKLAGGRKMLINSLTEGFQIFLKTIEPVRKAFREVFPKTTWQDLVRITKSFAEFVHGLQPSQSTLKNLHSIFKGFFSLLKLGWEIIKNFVRAVLDIGHAISGAFGGDFLGSLAKVGDFFTKLLQTLTRNASKGNQIHAFFFKMADAIKSVIPYIADFVHWIGNLFGAFKSDAPNKVTDTVSKVGDKFSGLSAIFGRLQQRFNQLTGFFKTVGSILVDVGRAIVDFVSNIGQAIADNMSQGNFNTALDAINTGLFGGLLLLIRKFIKNPHIDLTGGFLDKINSVFSQLTGTLKAMETQIKAEALKKIAVAIAILTASIVVLSLIDSVALTKAMTAMSVGFGELVASFAALKQIEGGLRGAANFTALAFGMTTMAGAILLLSFAAKQLAGLSWQDLAKGLLGVTALMGAMIGGMKLLVAVVKDVKKEHLEKDLLETAASIFILAVSVDFMAHALKMLAGLSWQDMAKGIVGVAVSMGILVAAMHLMPDEKKFQRIGLLTVAVALNLLAKALSTFSTMSLQNIGMGLLAMGSSLILVGLALRTFPKNMKEIGLGLLLVSVSLLVIQKALMAFASMSWEELGKGLLTLGIALVGIALAARSMEDALPGAAAIAIVAASMFLIAKVLEALGGLSITQILTGLLAIAGALAVFGLAALVLEPVLPAMELLGSALALLGIGLLAFGIGAYFAAKAFQVFGEAGAKGAKGVVTAIETIGKALPAFFTGFAEGFIDFFKTIGSAAPAIMDVFGKLLGKLLDLIITLIPKAEKAFVAFVSAGIDAITKLTPKFIEMGLGMLIALLKGISKNIGKIVNLVAEIIVHFLDAFGKKVPEVIGALADFYVTILTGLVEKVGELMVTLGPDLALALIDGFITGLEKTAPKLWDWFTALPTKILDIIKSLFGINSPAQTFIDIGVDLIQGLLDGINSLIQTVWDFFTSLPQTILDKIGSTLTTLWQLGVDIIQGYINGYLSIIQTVWDFFSNLLSTVVEKIGSALTTLYDIGVDIIQGYIDGYMSIIQTVWDFFSSLPQTVLDKIGDVTTKLWDTGWDIIQGLYNGMQAIWENLIGWVGSIPQMVIDAITGIGRKVIDVLLDTGKDLIKGLKKGMENAWEGVSGWFKQKIKDLKHLATHPWEIASPSKFMMRVGRNIMLGLRIGLDREMDGVFDSMNRFATNVQDLIDLDPNPTITPVLDLTKVQSDAAKIPGFVNKTPVLTPSLSFNKAQEISVGVARQSQQASETNTAPGPNSVSFTQTINAPKQLSTADIYKQTRNQITIAKEELQIR